MIRETFSAKASSELSSAALLIDSDIGNEYRLPPISDILTLPYRDHADQTRAPKINGSSSALDISPFVQLSQPKVPAVEPRKEYYSAVQKWEGYVMEVNQETFVARLVPVFGEGTDQIAEIYVEEVSVTERNLIKSGAVFYWFIGYLDRPQGRVRASIIKFRRLPVWDRYDLNKAEVEAARIRSVLDVS